MEAKELTKEMLVGAANDLNKVLELKPPVATEFTSSLKGAALKAVEKKFTDQLCKDLVEVATCTDSEGKPLLQPTDPLQPETVNVLEAVGVEGIRERVGRIIDKKGKEEVKMTTKSNKEVSKKKDQKKTAPAATGTPIKGKKEGKEGKGKKDLVDHSTSNKARIYTAWKSGKTDIMKLLALVDGAVKETSVKGWINAWTNGKNLPAIANVKK